MTIHTGLAKSFPKSLLDSLLRPVRKSVTSTYWF